ncbi:hypothetical protein, partial [Bradyrhizobium sp. sGM-13]|uniref:hypothetical protein n=1 Tax=Bradyrhizobium sp. sGM-13 TaxID=2831781 RepID=UPI001BD15B0E
LPTRPGSRVEAPPTPRGRALKPVLGVLVLLTITLAAGEIAAEGLGLRSIDDRRISAITNREQRAAARQNQYPLWVFLLVGT